MKPDDLIKLGYHELAWNGGIIMEYWKGLRDVDSDSHRIGVRLNEWKDKPFIVYLFFPRVMIALEHIKTITEVEVLYALLRKP
jgi:hypothetical protein